MNTLKFQKINNLATEQHNLEIEQVETVTIFGKKYNISVPCNLNIIITDKCPCNCFFCIEHQTVSEIDNGSTFNFKQGLNEVLKELNPRLFEITITGGEPTCDISRLKETMEMCHHYGFKCRTFSTTAFDFESSDVLKTMIDCNFTHNINVSRMSISQKDNENIFCATPNDNEKIEKLAKFFKCNNAEMRLSCNLINGVVDSMDKIFEYVDFYNNLGVDSVLFRELFVQSKNADFNDRIVRLENIFDSSSLKYIETLHSNYYDVDVYSWKDYIVKHYKTSSVKTTNISSMSYKNGILRNGFIGEKIFEYGK